MLFRLAACCSFLLAFAAPAHGAVRPVAGSGPDGLKGFLLRADEPVRNVFPRTPSFAWKPVPGAIRYEFQLSTSSVFRENGIVFSDEMLTSPAASVPLTLPWITGSPYSLYARARAVLEDTITPWSKPFGFNLRWETQPKPLPSYPGLLRWTPVEGARGYQVWFIDIPKFVTVHTNVVDEREFYTFHQGTQWMSSVRWRIRAIRWIDNKSANGLPPVSYGSWSPVYSSVNPPFAVGPLGLTATASDVVAKGRSSDSAHRLMPAFVFTGNQATTGTTTELYRVYAFTDKDCLNPVFRSALVGSPAYAPRPFGPLGLPRTIAALQGARAGYLADGDEGAQYTADYGTVKATEAEPAATPLTELKPAEGSSSSASSTPSTTGPAAPGKIVIDESVKLGAPVDLWDTEWPEGGYYWTVIPVVAQQPAALATSLVAIALSGAKEIEVPGNSGLAVGDTISIGPDPGEQVVVVGVSGTKITISRALTASHGPGEPVARVSGNLVYREVDLPQEVCAAGRVMRFGKTSEPALTSSSAPFASGLSPTGRLIAAATKTPRFYGTPHVAWTPALGAAVYEVQWSKTGYPFRAEIDARTGTKGFLTLATSAILPLKPGTWWYRVRGINYSLPTGAQQMSWSDPAKIIVSKPRFRVERGRGR